MQVMSIKQLIDQGWSRTELNQIAHSKNSPAFKTSGGGKWLFDMNKFDKFVEQRKLK
ncbi:MAG: hypothetical protein PUC65_05450 [Clostridiales bacterium]|nr:hypothetical protein [Clostridiales bacterium]